MGGQSLLMEHGRFSLSGGDSRSGASEKGRYGVALGRLSGGEGLSQLSFTFESQLSAVSTVAFSTLSEPSTTTVDTFVYLLSSVTLQTPCRKKMQVR